jgi:site-specific recombinase XerD
MGTALAAVQDYLAVRWTIRKGPDHGALFLTQYGKRLVRGGVYTLFEGLDRQRGPNARRLPPHLLRHSIAVHLLRAGAGVRYIQQLLGHGRGHPAHPAVPQDLETTKVYLRLVPGQLREDYDKAMPVFPVEPPPLVDPTHLASVT